MKRIHVDSSAPKYQSGMWSWDEKTDSLHFQEHSDLENANERYIDTNGFKFLRTINQEEEIIFREVFVRHDTTFDADTVVITDVRDLVLFLMPKEFLSFKFIEFMHMPAVHRLLHALTIYFENFLRFVEFILIRRDELAGDLAQMQSEQTNEVKRIWSSYLSQYRMLLARNYSIIVKGERDFKKFYHTKEIVNISSKIKDRFFHESFLAVATQFIWITLHRRAYYMIEMEMNRLFRSEHFLMSRPQYPKFTPAERCLLYGRNNKIFNYRYQSSPMIQELIHIENEDMPILWIGERKYRGTDPRIAELELEYIVPCSQLRFIDISRGILGHPKNLYNTILAMDWSEVRHAGYSSANDPYNLIRQPHLRLPNINEMAVRKASNSFELWYRLFRIYEPNSPSHMKNWTVREKILDYYRSGGAVENIYSRCEKQLAIDATRASVSDIVSNFLDVKARLRKKKSAGVEDSVGTNLIPPSKQHFSKKGFDYYFKDITKQK